MNGNRALRPTIQKAERGFRYGGNRLHLSEGRQLIGELPRGFHDQVISGSLADGRSKAAGRE